MFQTTISGSAYTLILLRHGESTGNAMNMHQGQQDFPLSPQGEEQVRRLAERWTREQMTFDAIISSPLQRARQTAEAVAAALNTPLELEPLWLERNVGLLQGLTTEESQRRYPRPQFIHIYQPIGGHGESQWELYLRAGQALQKVLSRPPGRYLIVAHGGILNMAMYAILGIPPQANFTGPRFRFGNTSFATLTYLPAAQHWTLLGVHDHAHLEP